MSMYQRGPNYLKGFAKQSEHILCNIYGNKNRFFVVHLRRRTGGGVFGADIFLPASLRQFPPKFLFYRIPFNWVVTPPPPPTTPIHQRIWRPCAISILINAIPHQVSCIHGVGVTYKFIKNSSIPQVESIINSCKNIFCASYELDAFHGKFLKNDHIIGVPLPT